MSGMNGVSVACRITGRVGTAVHVWMDEADPSVMWVQVLWADGSEDVVTAESLDY